MRSVGFALIAAVALLAPACAPSEVQLREMGEILRTLSDMAKERPTLRETPDGCAADPTLTNPFAQRVRVIVSYRVFDADGKELPGLRVEGQVPGRSTVLLHGEITPGLACAGVVRIKLDNAHLDSP